MRLTGIHMGAKRKRPFLEKFHRGNGTSWFLVGRALTEEAEQSFVDARYNGELGKEWGKARLLLIETPASEVE